MRCRGVSYPQAAVELKALQDFLGGAPIVVEINGPGVALAQEFERLCVQYVPFTTTAQSKQEVVMTLAADVQPLFDFMRIRAHGRHGGEPIGACRP